MAATYAIPGDVIWPSDLLLPFASPTVKATKK